MLKLKSLLGVAALASAALLAVPTARAYTSFGDEFLAAEIYKTYHPHDYGKSSKLQSVNEKISKVQSKISNNELEISKLESKRSDLDHDLAVLMQNEEYYSYNGFYSSLRDVRRKIENKNSEISRNESKIAGLKGKRSDLDHDLAVLMQQKELYLY